MKVIIMKYEKMNHIKPIFFKSTFLLYILVISIACSNKKSKQKSNIESTVAEKVMVMDTLGLIKEKPSNIEIPDGMVWIPGGTFIQGAIAHDKEAMSHEKPAHKVAVDGYFMDTTLVTNRAFSRFVKETGYVTIAERKPDWEELKKQVPEGTPKPPDSVLQPGSLIFKKAKTTLPNLYDFSKWWEWSIGANWKQPEGPGSSISGKEDHPVVHIAYEDALAYCKWANRRLPTETEWEFASRAGKLNTIFFWGDDFSQLSQYANTWEGEFPVVNLKTDGYESTSPVAMFPPNANNLYDMSGNVWEWTSDWYNAKYYQKILEKGVVRNPKGAETPFNSNNPLAKEKIIRGGSYLCNAAYCSSYRISARMSSATDSSTGHLGFRTVVDLDMLSN